VNPHAEAVLAPIGGWLLAHEWTLDVAFWLLLASAIGLLLLAAYGVLHLVRHLWNAAADHWNNAIAITRWAESYGGDHDTNEPRREESKR
jgi:hypothetical protein